MKKSSRRFIQYIGKHPEFAIGLLIVGLNIFLMVFAPLLVPYPPEEANFFDVRLPPSSTHLFGTDQSGMDIFSRVIYAPRIDVTIALAGTFLSLIVGVVIGIIVGYWKNWLTEGIQRIADLFQAFPVFVLAMALVAVTGQKMTNVILVIAFLNVPIYMRLMRSNVLSTVNQTFVEAAVSVGNSDMRILFRHILPNTIGNAITQASVNIGWAILLTSGLSFIGAGVPVPTPEWGAMIAVGAPTIITGEWWSSVFPGLAIALTALGFSLVGDGLKEYLDPTGRN
jgi:peptide/nickel transport system permease protein